MNFNDVRAAFSKGSVVLSDGKMSIFYKIEEGQWAGQSFSNMSQDGKPDLSKRVFESLVFNAEKFEMHFYADGKMRFDFVVPGEMQGGNVKYCWFMPLKKDKSPEEFREELLEALKENPPRWLEFLEFISEYDIDNPAEMEAAVLEWTARSEIFEDDTPVSEEEQDRWENMLEAARDFYRSVAIGAMEVEAPEPGSPSGFVEFQTETYSHLDLVFTGKKKELLVRLMQAADVVSFESGNNDGGRITYINFTFYS